MVSRIDSRISEFIKQYRLKYSSAGQYVIKVVLDEYCRKKGIKKIRESSIARVIKKLKENGEIDFWYKMIYDGRTGKASIRNVKRKAEGV